MHEVKVNFTEFQFSDYLVQFVNLLVLFIILQLIAFALFRNKRGGVELRYMFLPLVGFYLLFKKTDKGD